MTLEHLLVANQISYKIKAKELISDISMTFRPGLISAILGPNGSGKTTFLKNLAGIWPPSSGNVLWNGHNLFDYSRKDVSRIVSIVPQSTLIPFDFTVMDMIEMGRYMHRTKNDALIKKTLKNLDVWHLRNQSISRVSGGERQRVYIARALVTEAPILLLDEPTAHLDIGHELEIWRLLKELASDQRTIIVTTHDLRAAKRHCDQIALLHYGKCIGSGPFDAVMTAEKLKTVFGVQVKSENQEIFELG